MNYRKKYTIYIHLIFVFVFIQCTNQVEKDELVSTTEFSELIDTSTSNSFIQSIIQIRNNQEKNTPGFEMEGELIFEKNDFKIFTFHEGYDEYNLNNSYTIILNPSVKEDIIFSTRKGLTEVPIILDNNEIYHCFYEGILNPSFDFKKDGYSDFILENEYLFKNNVNSFQQIIMYEGENIISPSLIKANSHTEYIEENYEEVNVGQNESFTFSEDKQKNVTIYLNHDHYYIEEGKKIKLEYKIAWRWNQNLKSKDEGFWNYGFISTPNNKKMFNFYSRNKLISIFQNTSSEYDDFIIIENCQNGEPEYFTIKKYDQELFNTFILLDGIDDVANYIVFHIEEVSDKIHDFFIYRHENLSLNTTGYNEIDNQIIRITLDYSNPNFIQKNYESKYTLSPENFEYKSCED